MAIANIEIVIESVTKAVGNAGGGGGWATAPNLT